MPSWRPPSSSARRAAPPGGRAEGKRWRAAPRPPAAASPAQRGATPRRARGRPRGPASRSSSLSWGRMLPFTPEGVLLQEGDARREPPIVLARRAGTPYRNGQEVLDSVAHPLEPAAPTAGSWHFRGDVRALALGHAGLLLGSPGGAAEGRPGHGCRGGAMIGRAALRHKRFQEAGAV